MRDIFTAWRLSHGSRTATRLDCKGGDLAEALQSASRLCQHKDVLFVLHTDRISGIKRLHCFVIRNGKREYRVDRETGIPGMVTPSKPDCIFDMAVIDFHPAEPWSWTPGADVVGIDPSIIEVRP